MEGTVQGKFLRAVKVRCHLCMAPSNARPQNVQGAPDPRNCVQKPDGPSKASCNHLNIFSHPNEKSSGSHVRPISERYEGKGQAHLHWMPTPTLVLFDDSKRSRSLLGKASLSILISATCSACGRRDKIWKKTRLASR